MKAIPDIDDEHDDERRQTSIMTYRTVFWKIRRVAKVSQNRSTFKQLNLLVLAKRDLGRVGPVRRVLPAVLDQAVRMAILL